MNPLYFQYLSTIKEAFIDLPKQSLPPDIFENDKLKEEVRTKILSIWESISKKLKIKYNYIYLTGSCLTKYYSFFSDLDVIIVTNYDEDTLIEKRLKLKNFTINNPPEVNGREIEFYLSDKKTKYFEGEFDIVKNKFVKKANFEIKIIEEVFQALYFWVQKIELLINELKRDIKELFYFEIEKETYLNLLVDKENLKYMTRYKIKEIKMDIINIIAFYKMIKDEVQNKYEKLSKSFQNKIIIINLDNLEIFLPILIKGMYSRFGYLDLMKYLLFLYKAKEIEDLTMEDIEKINNKLIEIENKFNIKKIKLKNNKKGEKR